MSNAKLREILQAMLEASGVMPEWEYDYYEEANAQTRANFINGLVRFFKIDEPSGMFHYNSLGWFDSPSETLDYFIANKEMLEC